MPAAISEYRTTLNPIPVTPGVRSVGISVSMTWGIHDDVSGLRARIRYPILFHQHAHDPDDPTKTFDTKVFTLGTHEADRLPPR